MQREPRVFQLLLKLLSLDSTVLFLHPLLSDSKEASLRRVSITDVTRFKSVLQIMDVSFQIKSVILHL